MDIFGKDKIRIKKGKANLMVWVVSLRCLIDSIGARYC